MAVQFAVGPGIAAAMAEDQTTPATDEIFAGGVDNAAEWSVAVGSNNTVYRWVQATNSVLRFRPKPTSLAGKLASVVDAGLAEGNRRYAGPILGEPESFRRGNPGYDTSSFVALMYLEALGITMTMFTDAIADETDQIAAEDALPGDIILYRYDDASQPSVVYPHCGLWLSRTQMSDSQFPVGLGVHPLLNMPFEIHRARGL